MLNSKNFVLRILLEIPHTQKKIWQPTVQNANLIKMHLRLLLEFFKVYNITPPNFRVFAQQKVPAKCFKICHILKRFTGSFYWAQTLKLEGVIYLSLSLPLWTSELIGCWSDIRPSDTMLVNLLSKIW